MRDEMDGRIWDAHHEQLSDAVDKGLGALGASLGKSFSGKAPNLLLSVVAAVAVTGLTLSAASA